MKAVLAASLLAAVPMVALAQPADDFARGRELRLAGRPAEAIPHLEAASRASAADADIWLNLGLAYMAAQRHPDAERALAEARRLAPDYADVQVAQARLAYYQGDLGQAQSRLAPLLAGGGPNDEASALAAQIAQARAAAPAAWRLDMSFARSDLSASGLEDWLRGSIGVSRRLGDEATVTGYLEQSRQFGLEDTYLEATVAGRRGYVAFGGAVDADFRPEWQVRAGVYGPSRSVGNGWNATLSVDGSWAQYFSGDVRSVQPAVTVAKGDSYVLVRWINTLDERDDYRSGYSLYGVFAATPRLRVSGGFADAPESNQGFTADVRSVSTGVAIDLDAATTVRLDGVYEMRRAYDRTEFAVGVTRRF
ncbi:YaiO family outer membrane beta-barrel protein [Phenylobacterium sp. J367]|uniref:YaiO family outer membrane beta-barrel protein n=1 Tax=Phenylobacterium sp. J367 TaxID=2898435 RepID=UPI00215084D0|nr:YaiO family outer membrane beta-barrel protein [Phenylobacterium sp. J367]MCR5879722.1 YaiO family outer membrane beta-barrel protein [Phenylobacterium sp. J367]